MQTAVNRTKPGSRPGGGAMAGKQGFLEKLAYRIPGAMGTPLSIGIHTILFGLSLLLIVIGIDADRVMLVLTTIVSLEAIYLSLFIQMSVNRQHHRIKEVAADVEEIQEDIEEIQEDVEDLTEEDTKSP